MAVDTKFARLLEDLKVEDPWLPPNSWESIPSESGLHSSSSSSHPPNQALSHLSTLSVSSSSNLFYSSSFLLSTVMQCVLPSQTNLVDFQHLLSYFLRLCFSITIYLSMHFELN